MRKVLFAAGLMCASLLAQRPGPPSVTQFDWWNPRYNVGNRLNLSEAQLKQVNDIRQAYYGTVKDLNDAVNKAEAGLNEIYNQDKIDEIKAGVAEEQYIAARNGLTHALMDLSLKMRLVLTPDQWRQLEDLQNGRVGRGGRGRGRGGAPGGSGPASGTTSNKVGPAISQAPH